MARILTGILLLLIVLYGVTKALPLIRGPRIAISELSTSSDGLTILSGKAIHTESLSLDGGPLLIDSDGSFKTELTLPRGNVILSLTATDRFGRARNEQKSIVIP